MVSTQTDHEDARGASTAELLRSLLADLRLMIDRDAELARLELKDKRRRLQSAGGLLAGAVIAALLAFQTLTAAAVLAVAEVMPAWAAAILVFAVLVVVGLALFVMGRSKARSVGSLAPKETIQTAREDATWVRMETERLRSTE